MPGGLLEDVTVLDLTEGVAGPFATKLLADQGAHVIKVEHPGRGDRSRSAGPFPGDLPHPEKSGLFLYLNTNKQGVTLDITCTSGKALLRRLAAEADILVEDSPPGFLTSLGLGYDSLERLNPRLIMTSITPFGQGGPYSRHKGEEILYQAMGGFLYLSGELDREPVRVALSQGEIMGARNAALASMQALWFQGETGQGQYIDVSIHESVVSQPPFFITQYAYLGLIASRGPRYRNVMDGDYIQCGDGYVCLTTGGGNPWSKWVEFLGEPRLAVYDTQAKRAEGWQEVERLVVPRLQPWKRHDFLNAAMAQRFVVGVVQSPRELLDCPQLTERGFWVEVVHPVAGRFRYPGTGFLIDGQNPLAWNPSPAPLLGQHNEEVFCHRLGLLREDMARLAALGVV